MSPFHHCRFGSVLDGNCPALTEWPALFSCPGSFGWAKSGETPPNQPGKPNKALRKIFVGDRPQGCIVHEASLNCKAFPKLLFEAAPGVRRNAEDSPTRMGIFRNLQPYSLVPRLGSGRMRRPAPHGWNSPESRASIRRYHESYPLTHFIRKKPCRGRALSRPVLRKRHASGKRPRPAGTLPNPAAPLTGAAPQAVPPSSPRPWDGRNRRRGPPAGPFSAGPRPGRSSRRSGGRRTPARRRTCR